MKKYFLLLCIVVSIFFISGCKNSSVNSNEIKFLTWGSSTEMSIMKPIIEEYNNTHKTKVQLVHVPQNYFQKLHLLFASNLAPDVIFINNLYLPIYQKADLLEDLSKYINKEDYFQNALETLSINGKIYAIPRDVSSMVVFYNKDIINSSNIKMSESWDLEEFYTTAKVLRQNNDYGFCTEFDPGYWENFVSSVNKPLFLNGNLTIKERKSLEALQKLADVINKDNLSPNKEQLALTPCAQLFIQGKAPMFISGRWSVPKINNQANFEYDVMPFPKDKSKYYIPLNASGWAVSKASKNKSGAIDFVLYLSSKQNIEKLAESGLITPANKEVAFSDYFRNGKVFIDIIETSTPNIVPNDYNVIIDKVKNVSKSVLEGYKSAEEAFSKF